MKKFTRILQVMTLLLLSSSFVFAQSVGSAKQAAKDNIKIKKEIASPSDKTPETVKTVVPTSNTDALYDLVWKVPTHGFPTAYNEAGIETDDTYIYTTRWNTNGAFFRYDMAGTFVDGFTIASAGALRDLAYDPAAGRMYGGAGATTVYEMNFTTFTLVSSFVAPTAVRAIAWDNDLNIFYANNWSTAITKFTKAGVSQGSFPCGPVGQSYYGFAYCPAGTCFGPFLYGYAQVGATPNTITEILLPAGTETGNNLDITTLIAATTGIAGGLCFYTDVTYNKHVIAGCCQNEWLFALEICNAGGTQPTNDVSVSAIVAPVSGWNLGSAEPVTVSVKNFGTASQSNIPVYFTLNGGAQQPGTVPGPLAGGAQVNFTFTQTVNLSAPGTYTIVACTALPGDENPANDCKTSVVTNQTGINYCAAGATTCDEYIDNVQLNTINNSSGCGLVGGYSDYTAISTTLSAGVPYTIIVHNPVPWSGDVVDCWIDWGQDNWDAGDLITTTSPDMMTFTSAPFTIPSGAVNGNTRFRTRIYYYPAAADPCGTSSYGEVEDYTVNLSVVIYPNDVGVQSIDAPVGMIGLGAVSPMATVKNFGTNTNSFPVNMTIGAYSNTKTVTNLAPGATQQVTFDSWTPPGQGSYNITACTQLVGDEQTLNDCKSGTCTVVDLTQMVYGYNAYDPSGALVEGPVSFLLANPGALNLLAPTTSADFIAAGSWMTGNRWIGFQYVASGGSPVYEINPGTGAMTMLGTLGAPIHGASYCWDDGYFYGVGGAGANEWYRIDPATWTSTLLGSMGADLYINTAYNDATDMFYSLDISTDNLVSVNKNTGAVTVVGPTGLALNYAQDMEVDNNTGTMYAAAYTSTGQLCIINQGTGAGTVVGNFQGGAEICGFAIPYAPFTGITLDVDLWLEGPYDPLLDGGMNTWLNPAWIPLGQPFGSNLYNPTPCWYYTGTESVAAIPAGVVDWVLVELRDGGTTGAFTVAKQALFIKNNGKIVALDGTVPIFPITVTGPLYVVVYHRNHQPVMSSAGAIGSGTNYSWNFKTGSGQYYGGVNGAKQLEVGVWGARAGDGNADKQTNNDDKLIVWKPESGTSGYKAGDYNLDAQVNNPDKVSYWKPNSGTASQVPN